MPHTLHPFMALRRPAAGVAFAVALALASVTVQAAPQAGPQQAAPTPSDDPVTDALEPLLAAEFAVQSGRLDDAARWYLEAAQAAQDVELAERATRIALLAGDNARAVQALELWRQQGGEGTNQLAAAAKIGNAPCRER